nr:hypothetical protein [Tanacetum cinerariifolium]
MVEERVHLRGAFGGDGEEDFVMGEGVVVSSSSLDSEEDDYVDDEDGEDEDYEVVDERSERKPRKGQNRIKTGQKRKASSSKLSRDQTSNPTSSTNPTPKGRIRRSSKQKVENSHFEEHLTLVATMTDNYTMAEMLHAPTEGCVEAIVVPPILAEQFELKHSLVNMMTSEQFFGLEKDNPHDQIWVARRWLEKGPPRSITTWDDFVSKFINEFFPPHELQTFLDTFYNALNPADQDSLNAAVGGNLLEKSPQDALMIIENKSKVHNSRSKSIASPVNACDINSSSEIAKLTHVVNQQTSAVATAMTAMLKQLQANPPPAQVNPIEEICVTYGGAHPYYQCLAAGGNTFPEFRDNIQGYVLAVAGNYNQGNPGYRPQGIANQMRPPGFAQPNVQNNQNRFGQPQGFNRGTNFNQEQPYQATTQSNQNFHLNELEKIKMMNDVSLKAMHNQIDMVKNELRNEMKTSIQTFLSNQTNEIKNMMDSLLQMNTASTSGSRSLPGNTVANPKGKLKAITTRSRLVTDGPTVPTPPKYVTPEEDECVEETYTDPDLAEYTIKVPPPPVQKPKPPIQRNFVLHTRDSPLLNIPYPSRMLKQKQQEKDDIQIQKFWNMFKQLHLNIALAEALVLMPKYQKMLKALLSNKEKLQELANTPLNENHSAVILKKLPEKLGDPGKFLIPCGFSLPDLILTRMTLELANRAIYTPDGIARDVFVPVDIDSFNDIHPYFDDNPLSGSTTYSSNSLLEEFTNELALITYPLDYDDNLKCDIESHLREIGFLLKILISRIRSIKRILLIVMIYLLIPHPRCSPMNMLLIIHFRRDSMCILEIKSDADNFYDDPFDSKDEKIKEVELLIDELDLPCDIHPYSEYDSFASQDFSREDNLPSPDNEDKVFNPGILIHEKLVTIITRIAQEKKLSISYASLVFEDFDPLFYEPLVFKDVPNSMRLLLFSSENEENVFKPGIYTSEK